MLRARKGENFLKPMTPLCRRRITSSAPLQSSVSPQTWPLSCFCLPLTPWLHDFRLVTTFFFIFISLSGKWASGLLEGPVGMQHHGLVNWGWGWGDISETDGQGEFNPRESSVNYTWSSLSVFSLGVLGIEPRASLLPFEPRSQTFHF
jgi:hypothetical protein